MKHSVCYILLLMFLPSCHDWRERQNVTRLVNEWQGREVLIPDNMVFTSLALDTVPCPDWGDAPYKVFTYADGASCLKCQLLLPRWKDFIAEIDTMTYTDVPFLFCVATKDVAGLKYLLKIESFSYPICIDKEDRINGLNHFPSRSDFHTFLLDGENRVLAIGNPVNNQRVRDLYVSEIKKNP